jgi:hypothetical protein
MATSQPIFSSAGTKRSANDFEEDHEDSSAYTGEPNRPRTQDGAVPPQPTNVLAGKKRMAEDFEHGTEQLTASTHDAKRPRTEAGSDGRSHSGAGERQLKGPARRPLRAPRSPEPPLLGTLEDFPPITQPLQPEIPSGNFARYLPNHLQGHFLRRFIEQGWRCNTVYPSMHERARKALAEEEGVEYDKAYAATKARFEEEKKMAEEKAQALLESAQKSMKPTTTAPAALTGAPFEATSTSPSDHSIKEWNDLIFREIRKQRKIIQRNLGFSSADIVVAQMEDFWSRQAQAFENRTMALLYLDDKEIITPKGNLRRLLKRQNEVLTAGCCKRFPTPSNTKSREWHHHRQAIGRYVLKTQLGELQSWTALLEQGCHTEAELPRAPRGQRGLRQEEIHQGRETSRQLGTTVRNGGFSQPGPNYPQPQWQTSQHGPQFGLSDMGQPDEQTMGVAVCTGGYGSTYPSSTFGCPSATSTQTQPPSIASQHLPNVAYQQAPAQAGQSQPSRRRPGAPRRKMFVNAPSRDTPLPPSALTDTEEILNRFPEHLSNPVVMQRFVGSSTTGSRGHPTNDMVKALLQHANAHDTAGITEGQRRENIRRWVVKERDACNKQLKAGRLSSSVPPSMIAAPPAVQPSLQAPPGFDGIPIPQQNQQAPSLIGMPIPLQNVQAPLSYGDMPMPTQHLEAPPSFVSTPMPLQDPQDLLGYGGIGIPTQQQQEPSFANMGMPTQSLAQIMMLPLDSHAANPDFFSQLDPAADGLEFASSAYGYGQFTADPSMPNVGSKEGGSNTFGIVTESAATAASAALAPSAPSDALGEPDASYIPSMGEANLQTQNPFCEGAEVSQLQHNDFDTVFEEMDASGTWDLFE